MNTDILYKIVVLGDSTVGKTQLISRFTMDKFSLESKTTIGVEFGSKDVSIDKDNKTIKGQLWDTAGQERFQAITTAYFRGTHGAAIVYDITKKETFFNITKWMTNIKKFEPECVMMLVGNKSDLHHMRQVDTEEALDFAKKNNMFFLETSALENSNVTQAFTTLLEEIYNYNKKKESIQQDSNKKDLIIQNKNEVIKIETTNEPVPVSTKKCCG